jgi:hypothetical protein
VYKELSKPKIHNKFCCNSVLVAFWCQCTQFSKIKIFQVYSFLITAVVSWDVSVPAGFVCDTAAMLGVVIKERPCI